MPELRGMRLRGVRVALTLAPPVTVDNRLKLEFQTAVEGEAGLDVTSVDRTEKSVELASRAASARTAFYARLSPDELAVSEDFPALALDECVGRIDAVVKAGIKVFAPQVIAQTCVYVLKQVTTEIGDARVFLADRVLRLSEERKRAFQRPIHMVGLTFFLPPYQLADTDGCEVRQDPNAFEIKVESLNEDTRDIYLQCRAYFHEPFAAAEFSTLRERVNATESFIDQYVVRFLEPPPGSAGALEE